MALQPSNVVEWLQAERLAGNEWAVELLDLYEDQDAAQECADAIEDLRKAAPKEISASPDLWRLVEYITDRLALLEDVEKIIADNLADIAFPNGSPATDAAEKLEAAFDSPRWLTYDL